MATRKVTKRGSGEGSWKHLENGKWKVTITVGIDINGKQKRRSKTGTKKECMDWFKSHQEASCDDNFYEYAIKWLELRRVEITEGTYLVLRQRIGKIARINNFKIEKCNDLTINRIINILKPTMKVKTLNGYLATIRKILTYAFYKRHIVSLPYIPNLVDKQFKLRHRIPSIEQIKKILLCAKFYDKKFVYPVLLLGFSTGMRLGEVLALKKEDIDLVNNTISITKTIIHDVHGNGSIQEGAKTKQSNRIIYVNPHILNEFLKYAVSKSEYLFVDKKMRTLRPSFGSSKIRTFIRKTSYKEKFTMHTTRHTFITLTQESSIPLSFVSSYVGHSSNNTTLTVYTHPDIDKPNKQLDEFVLSFFDVSATL